MEEIKLETYYKKLRIKGYSINYVKIGDGQIPVFAFPGMLAPVKLSFTKFINLIKLYGTEKYSFYCWDTPGYFESSPPARNISDITFEVDADIAYELLQFLGHRKYNIIGHSAGVQIALTFALKYTNMVEKILLISGFNTVNNDFLEYINSVRNLNQVSEPFRTMFITDTDWDNNNSKRDTAEKHWSSWVDFLANAYGKQNIENWNRRYEILRNHKILIVTGESDKVIPEKETRELHEAIPNSKYKVFPEAGHRVQFEKPEEFYTCFDEFMS